MKKTFLSFMLLLSAAAGFAQGGSADGLTWSLSSGWTLTISGTGAIPDNYGTWGAKGISTHDIKAFVIEEGITGIGESVFSYHTEITSVTLPNSLIAIGDGAFMSCRGITVLILPPRR
jgi:hypothetical protein